MKRAVWLLVLLFPVALVAVACGGGGDDDGGNSNGENGTPDSGDNATPAGNDSNDDSDDSEDDGGSSGDALKGSAADRCPAIFSIDQVAALFGEDAVFEEVGSSTNDSLGLLHCVWSTVEDPDDADDLQSQLLQVQVYSGDPINGANFFDKDIYPGAEEIAGVGDEAFRVMNDYTITMAFVEGERSAFLDFSVIDLGGGDLTVTERADQVSDMFNQLHDRVTK